MRNPVTTTGDDPIRNPQSPIRNRDWRLDALALLALLGLLIVLLGPGLLSATRVLGDPMGDGSTQFYPWREFGYTEWRAHGLPLWNPYVFLGMPFIATLQSAMFYPTNLLCLAMPAPIACNLSLLINLFLSMFFTYLLGRMLGVSRMGSSLAAMTYALAANHVFRVYQGHWSVIEVMPWVPCLTVCVEMIVRRGGWWFAALGGVAVAMQIFAGQPQIMYYSGLFLGMYFLLRMFAVGERPAEWRERGKRIGMFASMFAIGVALGAVQFIPAMELAVNSSRAERITLEWASTYALPPENLLQLLAPRIFGPIFHGQDASFPYWGRWNFWETSAYMGLVSLFFALGAMLCSNYKRWLPFALPGAFFLLLALGPHAPLLRMLFGTVPGFDLFRVPARALAIVGLCAALMAGMGLDAFLLGARNRRRRLRGLITGFACALLIVAVLANATHGRAPETWTSFVNYCAAKGERPYYRDLPAAPDAKFMRQSWNVFRDDVTRSAAIACVAAILVLLPFRRTRALRWVAGGIVLLAAADFLTFGRDFMVTFDPADRIWNKPTVQMIQRMSAQRPFRVSNQESWQRYSCDPIMYHIATVEGIEPNVPSRFHDFFALTQHEGLELQLTNYRLHMWHPLLSLVNLEYVVTRKQNPSPEAGEFDVKRLEDVMPRAFVLHNFIVVPQRNDALLELLKLDFRRVVMLEKSPAERVEPLRAEEPIPVFKRYDTRGAEIRVNLKSAGLLVLSDIYYPGWVAKVDGRKTKIYRADYLLRAVVVPAGEHTVEFEYVCPAFGWGAAISVTGGGIVVGYAYYVLWELLMARRRKRGLGPIAPMRPLSSR